jgi:hypothetical protein
MPFKQTAIGSNCTGCASPGALYAVAVQAQPARAPKVDPGSGLSGSKKARAYSRCTPVALLGPHSASLGMRFYTGSMFPAEYKNAIFVARHRSWNRTKKVGGDIVVAKLNGDGTVKAIEPFLTGLLDDNKYVGRPTDAAVMKDGSATSARIISLKHYAATRAASAWVTIPQWRKSRRNSPTRNIGAVAHYLAHFK